MQEAWDEGMQCGAPGFSNWHERTSTEAWSAAGAQGASRSATPIASVAGPVEASGALVIFDLPNSVVQHWVDDPSTNFGFLLQGSNNDSGLLMTSEADDGLRPRLVVSYR